VSIQPRSLKTPDAKGRKRTVWDVKLRDQNGRMYQKTFTTKAEAQNYEAGQRTDRRRGTWIDPRHENRSVASVADEWLEGDTIKRASSAARDRSILRTHVLPRIGNRPIGSVTRADIQRLVNAWTATHKPSSVGRMYSGLRALFSYAEAAEIVVRTPCRDIKVPRAELVSRPHLNAGQLSALGDALGADQAAFMWLGAVLGLRWAEAGGLTVGAVDVLGSKLTVRTQLGRDGRLQPPKSSAGTRTMTIPQWLAEDLAAVMARRGLTGADTDELLFVSGEGAPLHYSNWRRRTWSTACAAAGLDGLRFHDLRSLAATTLIAAGVDVKTTQTRMGHSSPQMTLALYARATVAADVAAAAAVGDVLRPASRISR
jgi:integrase